ncbi:hypothetical protein ACWD4O_44500 [Streptomyces sp. NPDC002623]
MTRPEIALSWRRSAIDLPADCWTSPRPRVMTPLERAEHDNR